LRRRAARTLPLWLAFLALPSAFAQAPSAASTPLWCGTSQAATARQEALHRVLGGNPRGPHALATTANVRKVNGIYVVTSDATILAFDHPFDLAATSLQFRRTDEHTFEVSRVTPRYDHQLGSLIRSFTSGEQPAVPYDLGFSFPFGSHAVTHLYLTPTNAILLTAALPAVSGQQNGLDAVSRQQAMISPLFVPGLQGGGDVRNLQLYLREEADSVLITWVSNDAVRSSTGLSKSYAYEVQARLGRNGDIDFSYGVMDIDWGTVVVTTGEEPFYTEVSTMASALDRAGDVSTPIRTQWRDIMDITSFDVRRVGASDLIEFRIQVKGPLDRSMFASGDQFLYDVRLENGVDLEFAIGKDFTRYFIPGLDGVWQQGAGARVDGNTVFLRVRQDSIPALSGSKAVQALTFDVPGNDFSQAVFADAAPVQITFDPPPNHAESDLTELPQATAMQKPIFEAFTVPAVDLDGVWNAIKIADGLTDDGVDGVAVFQNFSTDILVGPAAAFSTAGNPGVDGITADGAISGYGSKFPRFPNLMHMNRLGLGYNNRTEGFVLAHEFAHRWLYRPLIKEEGVVTSILFPESWHPAQYVHTGAAHVVDLEKDSSVMGGGYFSDLGAGNFLTAEDGNANGYSLHELYLMGLASPSEVTPWFYLAATQPPLGLSYNPPPNLQVSGTRKNVVLQEVIDALGPRIPAWDGTHQAYRIAYVILERSRSAVSVSDVHTVSGFAAACERRFAVATGFRGSIAPQLVGIAVNAGFNTFPSRVAAGQPIRFLDASLGTVTSWEWSFGDGTSSVRENPEHVYTTPGIYAVTLRVSDGGATSSTTQTVAIPAGLRTRSITH
jgi:hypothetical protein